jgi:hypothetical protein
MPDKAAAAAVAAAADGRTLLLELPSPPRGELDCEVDAEPCGDADADDGPPLPAVATVGRRPMSASAPTASFVASMVEA